jgi:hypothetical protein
MDSQPQARPLLEKWEADVEADNLQLFSAKHATAATKLSHAIKTDPPYRKAHRFL